MIKFWRTTGPYGFMANFSKHNIVVDGKDYPTSEHYYQAQKFTDPLKQEMVRGQATPKAAKQMACTLDGLRPDWEQVKFDIMVRTLKLKVYQHPELLAKLIATGDEPLGEDSPYDYTWGLGKDGSGKNLLGKAWEEVRKCVKDSDPSQTSTMRV